MSNSTTLQFINLMFIYEILEIIGIYRQKAMKSSEAQG